jgi:hypothetical protein
MDHKEQHHQHHEKEREERNREGKRHDAAELKRSTPIHPAWFFAVAAMLVVVAMSVWILVY